MKSINQKEYVDRPHAKLTPYGDEGVVMSETTSWVDSLIGFIWIRLV